MVALCRKFKGNLCTPCGGHDGRLAGLGSCWLAVGAFWCLAASDPSCRQQARGRAVQAGGWLPRGVGGRSRPTAVDAGSGGLPARGARSGCGEGAPCALGPPKGRRKAVALTGLGLNIWAHAAADGRSRPLSPAPSREGIQATIFWSVGAPS